MGKSLNFSCVWTLVTLVTVISTKSQYPIWMMDLQDQKPGFTISNLSGIHQKAYLIDILNINSNVSFLVIQAHSYIENITLSFDDSLETNSYTTGTNVGLVWTRNTENKLLKNNSVQFYLFRSSPTFEKVKVLLAISLYAENDPIPGGCNMAFETMIAPYQKVTYDDDVITVTSQPPSKNEVFCDRNGITTDMYYMYLTEYDNDTDEYFFGIQRMITVQNILKYGTKVPSGLGRSKFIQIYNSYRGTGRVFAAISTLNKARSAYVPAISFGCNISHWTTDCIGPVGVHWKLMCAFLLILGTFVCFGGHRFFKTGLFTMGFTFGSITTLLIISIDEYFSAEVKALFSLATGIAFGCLWLLIWCKYGAPLVSLQLTCLLAGTLVASIVLYNELGNQVFLTEDVFFWLVFSIIVLVTFTPIFLYPTFYHIVALSLLGSYAFVLALNYYVGGNLPYILINTYRRMVVKDFGLVVVDPPYQFLDFSQTLLWTLLFGLGIYVQYKHSIGKAPFPPHRAGIDSRLLVNERTPLIPPAMSLRMPTAPYDEPGYSYFSERTPPPSYHSR